MSDISHDDVGLCLSGMNPTEVKCPHCVPSKVCDLDMTCPCWETCQRHPLSFDTGVRVTPAKSVLCRVALLPWLCPVTGDKSLSPPPFQGKGMKLPFLEGEAPTKTLPSIIWSSKRETCLFSPVCLLFQSFDSVHPLIFEACLLLYEKMLCINLEFSLMSVINSLLRLLGGFMT